MPSSANRSNDASGSFSSYPGPIASRSAAIDQSRNTSSSPFSTKVHPESETQTTPTKTADFAFQERLLNAREVAARLGVSERWVRDHTTRRSPKIRGVKLGTLMRYRSGDVEEFMERMTTSKPFLQPRFGG